MLPVFDRPSPYLRQLRGSLREFFPEFSAEDLVSLPNYAIYLKLMIEGVPSKAFSGETVVRPPDVPE